MSAWLPWRWYKQLPRFVSLPLVKYHILQLFFKILYREVLFEKDRLHTVFIHFAAIVTQRPTTPQSSSTTVKVPSTAASTTTVQSSSPTSTAATTASALKKCSRVDGIFCHELALCQPDGSCKCYDGYQGDGYLSCILVPVRFGPGDDREVSRCLRCTRFIDTF
jgi:hypothetical protein